MQNLIKYHYDKVTKINIKSTKQPSTPKYPCIITTRKTTTQSTLKRHKVTKRTSPVTIQNTGTRIHETNMKRTLQWTKRNNTTNNTINPQLCYSYFKVWSSFILIHPIWAYRTQLQRESNIYSLTFVKISWYNNNYPWYYKTSCSYLAEEKLQNNRIQTL